MSADEINVINKIAATLNQGGAEIVRSYTEWFFISSVIWSVIGSLIVAGSVWSLPKIKTRLGDDHPWYVISIVLTIIGAIMIIANLPDCFSPEGKAIHQLIKDLRG